MNNIKVETIGDAILLIVAVKKHGQPYAPRATVMAQCAKRHKWKRWQDPRRGRSLEATGANFNPKPALGLEQTRRRGTCITGLLPGKASVN
jgi:hypothetical protein